MVRDKARHFPHPCLALEKVFKSDGPVEDLIQLFDIGDAFGLGERKELLFHYLVWDQQRVRRQTVESGKVVPSSMLSAIEYLWR